MPSFAFNPQQDIPDLSGKVIFITGGTAGIGAESVVQLARKNPRAIYFSGRNAKGAEAVIERVKAHSAKAPLLHFVQCDLGSLQSVAAAAQRVLDESDRLDILMCNAGIAAKPLGLTTDGYELQFGTNHLGHALLIKKFLPLLNTTNKSKPNADVRIVITTSVGFAFHPPGGIVFNDLKTVQDLGMFGPWTRYAQSKLANVLYARELARRYPDITTLSVHPGVVETPMVGGMGFFNKLLIYSTNIGNVLTPEQGAYNQLWAACADKREMENGQMYEPVGVPTTRMKETSKDEGGKLAGQLWDWTEKELEKY